MKHRLLLLTVILLLPFVVSEASSRHDRKDLRMTIDLCGEWMAAQDADYQLKATDRFSHRVLLPGTTDTNQWGETPADTIETNHLTRLHSFKGRAWYSRDVNIPDSWKGKTILLTLERTKVTQVFVDGKYCGGSNDIAAPQNFDLSEQLAPGRHQLTISVDNSKGIPQQIFQSSHQMCEDTQTNWNGIIGKMTLEAMNRCHISHIDIRPNADGKAVVLIHFVGRPSKKAKLEITVTEDGKSLPEETPFRVLDSLQPASIHYVLPIKVDDSLKIGGTLGFNLDMHTHYKQWSEWQPTVYRLTARIGDDDEQSQTFGFVSFQAKDHHFYVNGRPTFLRGKHDACVFPLTAHAPMDKASWQRYFKICQDYGINHVRFHSWCPPEAAFVVADSMGLYLQPELPFWGDFNAKDSVLMNYLLQEGKHILKAYGHHPSFRMMSLGNELWGSIEAMQQFVRIFKSMDADKLYTLGTNYYLGYQGISQNMDYITTARLGGEAWGKYNTHTRGSFSYADAYRGGIINNSRPSTSHNFDEVCDTASVPVISHETGQFQTYPDYGEIGKYTGVLYPYNLRVFQRRLQQAGMGDEAAAFHRASGLWSKELYKADIEMDLRTRNMAGFHLLDLQDYPGQGSAYVGMLDAFMESKGLTTPDEWRQWCSSVVPLAEMDSVCYANDDSLRARILVANYAGMSLNNLSMICLLKDGDKVLYTSPLGTGAIRQGLSEQGSVAFPLNQVGAPKQLKLEVTFLDDTGNLQEGLGHNVYKVWVYPKTTRQMIDSLRQGIIITHDVAEAVKALQTGARVLLLNDSSAVGPLFTTDYWNYKMFKDICEKNHKVPSPGTLGLYIPDSRHPLFNSFPTEDHTSWQWYPVVTASSPVILDSLPADYRPLVQVIDNVVRNHRLGLVFEFSVGQGRLLVCASQLDKVQNTVEGQAFTVSLLRYMQSADFKPAVKLDSVTLAKILPN